jgi:phenylacetate-CoA ligase
MELQANFAHLTWPRLPGHRGCAILALLYQLEQTQWWPQERLLDRQLEQLSELVRHAASTVPFYRKRLAHLNWDGKETLRLEQWRQIPLLTRTDIQSRGEQLTSLDVPESHGQVTETYTSGSTGEPLRSLRTELWELYWAAFTVRDHIWHGRDFALKLGVIRESEKGEAPYPQGSTSATWGWSSGAVFETGPTVSLNVMSTTEQQAEWLARQDPDYLLTHPSIAERLARHCLENDVRVPRLRQILTISEILRPSTREACRSAWKAPVKDTYSAREAGYIALQCPQHDVYHLQSESVFVELINDAGMPCGPGEIGRVVVTPLHNFAMPLIRYDIGDSAEAGGPCSCGRGLPVVTRILGRQQNMLVLPSGKECWPLLSAEDLRQLTSIAPLKRYQFIQKTLTAIEIKVEIHRPLQAREIEQFEIWVREKFDPGFEIDVTRTDSLAPLASGKFFDFVSALSRN